MKALQKSFVVFVGLSALAQGITFSFLTDTWSYASGAPTVGFNKASSLQSGIVDETTAVFSASTTKEGITLKFSANFFGNAISSENSSPGTGSTLTNATDPGDNPTGFIFGTERNDSPGLNSSNAGSLTGGTFTRYQRWHFEFSTPITLDNFLIQDIDNLANSFRDIFAAEAYLPGGYVSPYSGATIDVASLPTVGTGIDPTYTTFPGTSLATHTLTAPVGSHTLLALSPDEDTGNPNNTANVRAEVGFDQAVQAFSIYSISNTGFAHRMSLDSANFGVIPEPSVSLLVVFASAGLAMRRRR